MLTVLSRFFSHKFRRKCGEGKSIRSNDVDFKRRPVSASNSEYEDNNAPLTQFTAQNEGIIVHTTVEVHNTTETATFPHDDCHLLVPHFRNAERRESIENIIEVKEASSSGTRPTMSRHVIDEVAEFYERQPYSETDVRILVSKNVIVYVLGTNHANSQCTQDVIDIIEKLKPESVLVELCPLRACGCTKHVNNAFQIAPKFTFRYLRSIITELGFLPAMIFFTDVFREHLVSEHSLLHYGGEFIAAMTTAQNINNCRLVLADRPIEITVKRQASAMGNWRGLRVAFQVTLALLFKRNMKRLMMSANRLVFDDPKTYEILVFERDLYLTYSIQEAAKRLEADSHVARIVAVLGQGHVSGIQSYFGKVPSEFVPFILSPEAILDQ